MTMPLFHPGGNACNINLDGPGAFVLELVECAATGYEWGVIVVEAETMLRVASSELVVAPSGEGVAGGANIRRFLIRATHPGKGLLRLQLKRCWEAAPVQIIECVVLCQ